MARSALPLACCASDHAETRGNATSNHWHGKCTVLSMRRDPRSESDSQVPTPRVDAPWSKQAEAKPQPSAAPKNRTESGFRRMDIEARAGLTMVPKIERRLDGIYVHVQLVRHSPRATDVSFVWTSGPFVTGATAYECLRRSLVMRMNAAPGSLIEVAGHSFPTVESALHVLWPSRGP